MQCLASFGHQVTPSAGWSQTISEYVHLRAEHVEPSTSAARAPVHAAWSDSAQVPCAESPDENTQSSELGHSVTFGAGWSQMATLGSFAVQLREDLAVHSLRVPSRDTVRTAEAPSSTATDSEVGANWTIAGGNWHRTELVMEPFAQLGCCPTTK